MFIRFYDKVLRPISKLLVWISCIVLIAVAIFMMIDIVMRYVFSSPILGDVEIIETVMVIIVFSSFAYTQTEKGHIHVTMVLERLPRKLAIFIYAMNSIIVAIASVAVTYGFVAQGNYVLRKNTVSAIIHIPYYPFYYISAVFMGVFAIVLIVDAIINVGGLFSHEYEKRVTESWDVE